MLARGRDDALLRFSLGSEYLKAGDADQAVTHLARAVELNSGYSAAWKLYGKALLAAERTSEAAGAWQAGIEAARRQGDKQALKEMQVFLRRLEKSAPSTDGEQADG
jgi:tetratricopeptide (TPR) repeat protein